MKSQFDRGRLKELLPHLRSLTVEEPGNGARRAVELLRSAGVHLCFTHPIPGLGVYGATRWVNGTPIIQLSLLWKSDDQMWFTLFHEIGHVLLHSERELFLNSDANAAEDEANEFAAQLLVPTEFNMEIPRGRNIEAVKALASKLGIAPSIVLGRAQRETRDFAWGHGLRRSVTVEQLNC